MSLNAATIEILLAKGLTGEDILEVARATEVKADRTNAERQARHRAKKRNAVTVTEAPLNEDTSKPEIPPVEASASTAPRGRAERGFRIAEDWEPPAVDELSPEAQALARQWPQSAYRAEAEAFRNYWLAETGKTSRKSNWNRAWANRIVAVNGKVMRQAKFSGQTGIVGIASSRPMNVDQLRAAIRFAEDNSDPERAAELTRQLAELRARPPDPKVSGIIAQTARSLSARTATSGRP